MEDDQFNEPTKKPVPMTDEVKKALKGNRVMNTVKFDYLKSKGIDPEVFRKFDRQTRRSITPAGFANAFFKKMFVDTFLLACSRS